MRFRIRWGYLGEFLEQFIESFNHVIEVNGDFVGGHLGLRGFEVFFQRGDSLGGYAVFFGRGQLLPQCPAVEGVELVGPIQSIKLPAKMTLSAVWNQVMLLENGFVFSLGGANLLLLFDYFCPKEFCFGLIIGADLLSASVFEGARLYITECFQNMV
ncbi:MAG: hypothetical protein GX434_02285 [Peptococcaceae bacterium]|nr:hypothetical protein [Peptococcaceae bacterium]